MDCKALVVFCVAVVVATVMSAPRDGAPDRHGKEKLTTARIWPRSSDDMAHLGNDNLGMQYPPIVTTVARSILLAHTVSIYIYTHIYIYIYI